MPLTVPVVVNVPVPSLSVNLTPLSRLSTGVKVAPLAGATPTWTGPVAVTTWLLVVKVPGVRNSTPSKTLVAVGTTRSSRDSRRGRKVRLFLRIGRRPAAARRVLGLRKHEEKKSLSMTSFLAIKSLPTSPEGDSRYGLKWPEGL